MFKVFSRPQIDGRHHEIWQGCSYVAENDLTKKFWNKPKSKIFWLHRKERNNADKLLRLEDENTREFWLWKIKSTIEAKQKLSKIPSGNQCHQESVAFHQVMFRCWFIWDVRL
jgi:hypothetical protein